MTEEIKSLSEEIEETTVETIEETTEKKDDKLKLDYGKERKLKKGTKVKDSWQYNIFRVFNVILMTIICILTLSGCPVLLIGGCNHQRSGNNLSRRIQLYDIQVGYYQR